MIRTLRHRHPRRHPRRQTQKMVHRKVHCKVHRGGTKPFIALDCEMVGIGRRSVLAEVAIVDYDGDLIYHAYVKPPVGQTVTNYRTEFSGITEEKLKSGKSFLKVQADIVKILEGKILVGHALENDLKALGLRMDPEYVRNTAHTQMFQTFGRYGQFQSQSLKYLAKRYLGKEIQEGSHNPAEDARTAMALFRMFESDWNAKQAGPITVREPRTIVEN